MSTEKLLIKEISRLVYKIDVFLFRFKLKYRKNKHYFNGIQ
jgi:hypothetical protein